MKQQQIRKGKQGNGGGPPRGLAWGRQLSAVPAITSAEPHPEPSNISPLRRSISLIDQVLDSNDAA